VGRALGADPLHAREVAPAAPPAAAAPLPKPLPARVPCGARSACVRVCVCCVRVCVRAFVACVCACVRRGRGEDGKGDEASEHGGDLKVGTVNGATKPLLDRLRNQLHKILLLTSSELVAFHQARCSGACGQAHRSISASMSLLPASQCGFQHLSLRTTGSAGPKADQYLSMGAGQKWEGGGGGGGKE